MIQELSVAFHIETSHVIYTANQMAGFYMKCNNGFKMGKFGMSDIDKWLGLRFFDVVVKIYITF